MANTMHHAIQRAISSLRGDDSQRIMYLSVTGYLHTITFGNFYTNKRRNWAIDGHNKPFSTITWQLTENVEIESVRLLGLRDVYPRKLLEERFSK